VWRPGDVIAGRHLFRGRPWHVWTGTVARDDADLLSVWLPKGSDWLKPAGSLFGEWTHELSPVPAAELRLSRPGKNHSILLFWSETGEFRGWYVNLEERLRRTPVGIDYDDQLLDVWVEPDGTWKWLDEDELAEAVARGIYAPAQADEIRAEGERVIADWPFPTGWEEWRPDPEWPVPQLPQGWEAVQGAK
jgi:hypothetical protein